MAYAHTLIPASITRISRCAAIEPEDLCNNYWIEWHNKLDDMVQTLLLNAAKIDDGKLADLAVYGPLEFTRRDLGALLIQRGRDQGLPYYLEAKKIYDKYSNHTADHIHPRTEFFLGGLSEATAKSGMGTIFRRIIMDSMVKLRDADRFWYQNKDNG